MDYGLQHVTLVYIESVVRSIVGLDVHILFLPRLANAQVKQFEGYSVTGVRSGSV